MKNATIASILIILISGGIALAVSPASPITEWLTKMSELTTLINDSDAELSDRFNAFILETRLEKRLRKKGFRLEYYQRPLQSSPTNLAILIVDPTSKTVIERILE